MTKILKLSSKQKDLCINQPITIGYKSIETKDTLKNSISYLELNIYNEAIKKINEFKNMEIVKSALNDNERSSEIKKLIASISDDQLKKACYILRDKKANKKMLVPLYKNYFLQVKCTENDSKKIMTVIFKYNKLTCIASETEDVSILQISTNKDFITIDDFINASIENKLSKAEADILYTLLLDFNENKNISLAEKIENKKSEIENKKSENKKKITDYLYLYF